MLELAFLQGRTPIQRIYRLQLRLREPGGVQHPLHEVGSFIPIAESQQAPDREGSVTEPAIAVVPVERSANALRQGRSRRRDNCSRRRKGEQLEGKNAAHHRLPVWALISGAASPFTPEVDGSFDPRTHEISQRVQYGGRFLGV